MPAGKARVERREILIDGVGRRREKETRINAEIERKMCSRRSCMKDAGGGGERKKPARMYSLAALTRRYAENKREKREII